jgi:hypothetical protein
MISILNFIFTIVFYATIGMTIGRVQVRWSKNLTREKIDSGEKSHPQPRVKF